MPTLIHYGDNKDGSVSFYGACSFNGSFNLSYHGRSLFQSQKTPENLKRDIVGTVARLYRNIAGYHLLANKHGAELAEVTAGADTSEILSVISLVSRFVIHVLGTINRTGDGMQEVQNLQGDLDHERSFVDTLHELCTGSTTTNTTTTTTTEGSPKQKEISDQRLKRAAERLNSSASPGDTVMFGDETIRDVTTVYAGCTDKMRKTLSLMFLIGSSIDSEFANSSAVLNLGLKTITRNQFRAQTEPPPDFGALNGSLKELQPHNSDQPGQKFGIAEYEDSLGFSTGMVVVDVREYDTNMGLAAEKKDDVKLEKLKVPLKHLCWFLRGSYENDHPSTFNEKGIQTLNCIGYKDDPKKQQSVLIYRLPYETEPNPSILTLHEFILTAGRSLDGKHSLRKPALGQRFQIAYMLASTVFGIHSSGWVHKNISSRSILMFHNPKKRDQRVPYLICWGIARSTDGYSSQSADYDPESNIYRHPQRYGQPEKRFLNEHDIYSLGVVLLEIGLWQTVSRLFARPLVAIGDELLPQKEVHDHLLRLTSIDTTSGEKTASREKIHYSLRSEVGDTYASVVERCLNGTFDVSDDDEMRVEASLRFRKQVVELLEAAVYI